MPTKLTVETVRVFECEEWDLLYLKEELIEEQRKTETDSPKMTKKESTIEDMKKVKEYKSIDDFFKQLDDTENEEEVEKDEKTKQEEMIKYLNEVEKNSILISFKLRKKK